MTQTDTQQWTTIIRPKSGVFDFNLRELLHYKFLMFLFIRRDFVAQYKQTLLGPLWLVIQPLFTTGIYSIVFGGLAKVPTDGIPQPVFYMAGTSIWNYFSSCLSGTANVFQSNAYLFGKVYFPRLIMPITTVINNLYSFLIQFVVLLVIYMIYSFQGASLLPNFYLFLFPLIIMQTAFLGIGVGLLSNALTVKYRDLSQLIRAGVSVWMWATPIIYPLSLVPQKYRFLMYFNPMAPIVELFRYSLTGAGAFPVLPYITGIAVTVLVLFTGLIMFHRAEQTFIDVI